MAADTLDYPWRVEQNELERLIIPVLDDQGDLFDVTGWVADACIKDRAGGETLYTWPDESVSVSGTSVVVVIPAEVSAGWTFRSGWWRLVLSNPAAADAYTPVQRVISGVFVVDPD